MQDGEIMWITYKTLLNNIQMFLNVIDDELSSTSTHPVQNKVITEAIEALKNSIVPAEKQVQNVLAYTETSPSEAAEGDMYIDSVNNVLMKYSNGRWITDQANEETIYIDISTAHIYIFTEGVFVDATDTKIDNTIYVTSLDELDSYTDSGLYTVCMTNRLAGAIYYTFTVSHRLVGRRTVYTQTLSNRGGYQTRTKSDTDPWSDWEVIEYATKAEVKKAIKIAKAAL